MFLLMAAMLDVVKCGAFCSSGRAKKLATQQLCSLYMCPGYSPPPPMALSTGTSMHAPRHRRQVAVRAS